MAVVTGFSSITTRTVESGDAIRIRSIPCSTRDLFSSDNRSPIRLLVFDFGILPRHLFGKHCLCFDSNLSCVVANATTKVRLKIKIKKPSSDKVFLERKQ